MVSEIQISVLQKSVAYEADELAYKRLFYHFYPLLKRFADGMLHNTEVAEELAGDVLLKIWTMGDKLATIADLQLYLFKSVKNAALNYLKSNVHQKSLVTGQLENDEQIAPREEDISNYSELQQIMYEAVKDLPEKCRLVFRLVKEYGLSYKQIATLMNISQNTIETHMRLALKKLKAAFDQYQQNQK